MTQENTNIFPNPEIEWSRQEVDPVTKDPFYTFGVVTIRIKDQELRLGTDMQFSTRQISPPSFNPDRSLRDSLIKLGIPGSRRMYVRSDTNNLFDTNDPQRINEASHQAQDLITSMAQLRASERVALAAEKLKLEIRGLTMNTDDPEILRQASIIEELTKSAKSISLPTRVITAAKILKGLQVAEVWATGRNFGERYDPQELVQYFTKESAS